MLKQVICAFLILISSSAFAEDDDPFTVTNLNVFAESDSLDNARREAMNDGTKQAFEILMKRLMPTPMHWKIDNIKKTDIYDIVDTSQVLKERMTSRSYMGTVSVTFNKNEIKNILNRLGANYADKYGLKTLVIPILKSHNRYTLWGSNDWNDAWGEMPLTLGLSNFAYAMGDLKDLDEVSPETVMKNQVTNYKTIMDRYEVDRILFIIADELHTVFDVKLRLLSFKDDITLTSLEDKTVEMDGKEIYKHLATDLLTKMDDYYKGLNIFDESNRVFRTRMVVPVESPKEWSIIRDKLFEIKSISNVEIIRTKNDFVEVNLIYNIEPIKMTKILAENNFKVFDKDGTQRLKYIKSK